MIKIYLLCGIKIMGNSSKNATEQGKSSQIEQKRNWLIQSQQTKASVKVAVCNIYSSSANLEVDLQENGSSR